MMIKTEYEYSDITERAIGCAMKVYQKRRDGYSGWIYNNCLITDPTGISRAGNQSM